jgi:hypothetical protein
MRAVVKLKDASIRCAAIDVKKDLHVGLVKASSDAGETELTKAKTYKLVPISDFQWSKSPIMNMFVSPSAELCELGQTWGPTILRAGETPYCYFKPRKDVDLAELGEAMRVVVVE